MFVDEAFNVLGFPEQEKYDPYKNTACIMYMGNMPKDLVLIGKEEQVEIKNDANAQKVATLAGIDCEWMIDYSYEDCLPIGRMNVNSKGVAGRMAPFPTIIPCEPY